MTWEGASVMGPEQQQVQEGIGEDRKIETGAGVVTLAWRAQGHVR